MGTAPRISPSRSNNASEKLMVEYCRLYDNPKNGIRNAINTSASPLLDGFSSLYRAPYVEARAHGADISRMLLEDDNTGRQVSYRSGYQQDQQGGFRNTVGEK